MRYFERTNRMSNILIATGIFLFIVALGALFGRGMIAEVFVSSNGDYVKGGVLFAIWFVLSITSLIGGIALKCVVRDATEELEAIRQEQDRQGKIK